MNTFTDRVIENLSELDERRLQTAKDLSNAANDAEMRFLIKKAVRTKRQIIALGELLEKESVTV